MIDNVERLYKEDKVLLRAMDLPVPKRKDNNIYYECDSWVNEFVYAMNEGLYSLSTTLVISGVGVRNYKNVGFIVDSTKADCYHIAKSDSGSSGSLYNNDFQANKPDFDTISELADYIKTNKAITMNEVNINVKIDGIVGLFINKCNSSDRLLMRIYAVKIMLYELTGIDYPIYMYDYINGNLQRIDLTKEQEEMIISNLECDQILCFPDCDEKPTYIQLSSQQNNR